VPGLRGRPADRPPRPARDDRVGLREVRPVLQDLVVLTPPLLVCVAFLIARAPKRQRSLMMWMQREAIDAVGPS